MKPDLMKLDLLKRRLTEAEAACDRVQLEWGEKTRRAEALVEEARDALAAEAQKAALDACRFEGVADAARKAAAVLPAALADAIANYYFAVLTDPHGKNGRIAPAYEKLANAFHAALVEG